MTGRGTLSKENAYTGLKSRLVTLRLRGVHTANEAMEICAIKILLEQMEFDRRMEFDLGGGA